MGMEATAEETSKSTVSAGRYRATGERTLKLLHVSDKGKSVTVKVVDKCPGCKTDDIDLSPAAFQRLAPLPAGRIQVTWNYV
jgi:expansin (peptidoglycan-binding protein)